MNKKESLIYSLLYAVDVANVKKQNLVQMALKVDAVDFVRIYNLIQQQDETTRINTINSMLKDFNKDELIQEIKDTFLIELESSIQESVVEQLLTISS